ncbi:MAG: flagellar protein FlgN [Clostridiales bacterium]|nr:flagellar protein FlgN [Clostridiales bacterium]
MFAIHADFEPLACILGMQLNANQHLLALVEEQRHSIINNEIDKLDALVRQQAGQLRQLTALEKKRLDATANLHVALNLDDRPYTLSELIKYAPKDRQANLKSLLDEFAALLEKLKDANNTNKMLLETNMELNDLMLNLLADTIDPINNIYCGDGQTVEERLAGPSLFDHQA